MNLSRYKIVLTVIGEIVSDMYLLLSYLTYQTFLVQNITTAHSILCASRYFIPMRMLDPDDKESLNKFIEEQKKYYQRLDAEKRNKLPSD